MTRWVAEDKLESRNAAVLSGGPVGNHLIQGIGAGFVPEVLNRSIIDEIITVTEVEAFAAGISSGATLAVALKLAARPRCVARTSSSWSATSGSGTRARR